MSEVPITSGDAGDDGPPPGWGIQANGDGTTYIPPSDPSLPGGAANIFGQTESAIASVGGNIENTGQQALSWTENEASGFYNWSKNEVNSVASAATKGLSGIAAGIGGTGLLILAGGIVVLLFVLANHKKISKAARAAAVL